MVLLSAILAHRQHTHTSLIPFGIYSTRISITCTSNHAGARALDQEQPMHRAAGAAAAHSTTGKFPRGAPRDQYQVRAVCFSSTLTQPIYKSLILCAKRRSPARVYLKTLCVIISLLLCVGVCFSVYTS